MKNAKNPAKINLPRATAQSVADRLTKGMGKPVAERHAKGIAKTLAAVSAGDVNLSIFDIQHIRKQERFWTEVGHILAK